MKNHKKEYYKLKSGQLSVRPFVFTKPSVSSISIRFLILLSLQVIMLAVTKSYDALCVVGASVLGAFLVALFDCIVNKSQVYKIIDVIIQGMLIGLLLPGNYPVLSVFLVSFSVLFISKCCMFKNLNSWINISAFAVLIAWFIGRKFFPSFIITSDLLNVKNPSVYLIQKGIFPVYSFDSYITSFLNSHILSHFSSTIPEGFISMMWDNHSVIPAFRFNFLTIISSVVIFSDNAFSGIVPSIFLIVYTALVRVFSNFIFGGMFNQGDVFLALFSSGVLFCTVFLMQRFGSLPITIIGKIIYGFLMGITAFVIVGCGTSPIGMAYVIIIGDILCMLIRFFEERRNSRLILKMYSGKTLVEDM